MATIYSPTIISNGLVLCLDAGNRKSYTGSGTTWNDLSGNGNTGTLTNGPTFSGDGSIVFDGTDDYVSCSFATSAITNITMQCWVNIANTNLKGAFIKVGGGANGYAIGVGGNGFDLQGNEVMGLFPGIRWIDTNVNYGTGWKFVTFSLNASSVPSIYLNDTLLGSYSGISPVAPTAGLSIGRNIGDEPAGNRAFNGKIAQVLFYNRALSQQEIQQNFNVARRRFGI